MRVGKDRLQAPRQDRGQLRGGRRLDRLIIDNRSHHRLGAWIVVYPGSKKTLDAGYRLSVRRGRLPRKR